MPILLILLLWAACLPVAWANPFEFGPWTSVEIAAATVMLVLSAAFTLRTWVIRSLALEPSRRFDVGQVYARLRRILFFVNLGMVALLVAGLGWGQTTQEALTIPREGRPPAPAPFAELAVPLPYFLIVFGCWLIYYDAERALHRLAGGEGPEFWSRAGYFLHNLRQLALLIAFPVGVLVTQQALVRFMPEVTGSDWYRVGLVAAFPFVIVFLPLIFKPVLGLRPLPPGATRDRLEALARRLHFRHADLLVWPTRGSMANAMIIGLIPRARYVIFTDRVLDEMPADELDAVFGHEVGHARHGHIWFYALFLILSITVLAAAFLLLQLLAKQAPFSWLNSLDAEDNGWLMLPLVAIMGAYIFVVFGFLSRWCERQADVFGCRAVSCANPSCTGHDETTTYPTGGAGLCPVGIRTFTRALERVYLLNGYSGHDDRSGGPIAARVRGLLGWVRAWQHSTMPRRVRFLLSVVDDRDQERRFQRRLLILRWGLAIGLGMALIALGQLVGWRELLAVL